MKLLKSGLMLVFLMAGTTSYAVEQFVPFDATLHKEIVMAIVKETVDSFFPGISCIPIAQRSMVIEQGLKEFEQHLSTPGYITIMLCVDNTPVGFVQYFSYKESCESIIRGLKQRGISLEQINQQNPAFIDQLRAQLPEKDVDAPLLGKIEGVAVAKNYQCRGYGRKLVRYAVAQLMSKGMITIILCVSEDNDFARKLYESEGFEVDESRSIPMMNIIGYSKKSYVKEVI